MTLNDLEQDLYRRLNNNTSADTATQTRYRSFLNETQRDVLSEPGMGILLNGSMTFASVASTPQYSIPQAIARVKRIRETTNDLVLTPQTDGWYYANNPDPSANTATPDSWIDLGYTGIATQPSAACELFVDSTSASDTNTAYIEGYRTGGYFRAESELMTGVTAVSMNVALTDWVLLTRFYLSAAAVGTVTLHEAAGGGTELSRIPIGSAFARYRRIALAPCPATAITYTVDFEWDPQNMAVATDEPLLPPRFHHLLAIGARRREYEKRDDLERWKIADVEYHRTLSKLKSFVFNAPDYRPHIGSGAARLSTLGPYYPAGI